MRILEDLDDRGLVLAGGERGWRESLVAALRSASLPDGRSLVPEPVDPLRLQGPGLDRALDLLEWGAVAVVDLAQVDARLFALLSWHARQRPRSAIFLRRGHVALPFELHEFVVHTLETDPPEAASRSRVALAEAAARGAMARLRPDRRRRERNGVAEALRSADRLVLLGEEALAGSAMSEALAVEPGAADLLLRAALLHRAAGRWPEAVELLGRAVAADPTRAPAWRELGIARDHAGLAGAEEALRRAVELDSDYLALFTLAGLLGRRGEASEALTLMERALEVSRGQLNLVLPVLVLRAARDGCIALLGSERDRVRHVLEIRRGQARATPPADAPWSHFDAAQACLLLGDPEGAHALVAAARPHLHAAWEAKTFGHTLDSFERARVDVAELRAILGLRTGRAAPHAPERRAPGRPFLAAARDAAWYSKNVPCAAACPVGTDAGAYVSLIARGRHEEAYRVARAPNPFASVCGRICAAPCEDACRRGKIDEPVAIRPLKRFLTELHGVEGVRPRLGAVLDGSTAPCMEGEAYTSHLRKLGAGTVTGRRVAVVGGGPAGLACAHDLAFLGHRVTLFESSERLGGMMRDGIPEYRLPRDVLDLEIRAILDLGVDVRLGTGLGPERTLDSLVQEGYEAFFLASGAGRGRDLEVEGATLDGVVRAIDFLLNVNRGFRMDLGRRVVVVGGGSVSIDVARTVRLGHPPDLVPRTEGAAAPPALEEGALRSAILGPPREVHLVSRHPMGEWLAQRNVHGREEVEEARREGVVYHPLRGVRRVLGREGRVVGVELAEVVRVIDEPGRREVVYGTHVAEAIACDALILAVGQEPNLDYLAATPRVRRTAGGLIEVDPATLATSVPGVFAGGDAAFGPRTLIEGVADGKRAARGIHAHFTGGRTLPVRYGFEEVDPRGIAASDDFDLIDRKNPGCTPVHRRTGISEVEGSFDEPEAVRQAQRCLSCHVQTVYDGSLCIACGRCTDVCPFRCLSLVPSEDVQTVGVEPLALAHDEGAWAPVLMLKDEEKCIRCGLCAERCPTGAMTMERFDMKVGGASP